MSEENTSLVAPPTGITALTPQGSEDFKQIIAENFGNKGLTLADLDKIKIPGGGGTSWEVPSVIDGEMTSLKELRGVIIAWADNKSWWHKSYDDTEKTDSKIPDCKSNDLLHGVGNPNMAFNDKETQLLGGNGAGKTVQDAGGWLCNSCVHNRFGSAARGGGKSCQDKRFIVMLLEDSLMPVLIRIPATSIQPIKDYFKRLVGASKSYLSVMTGLSLVKIEAAKDYSKVVPKAVRYLTPEETAAVRTFRIPFQQALDASDAIEMANSGKGVDNETLDDMPQYTSQLPVSEETEAARATAVSMSVKDIRTDKQMAMISGLAREKGVDANTECKRVLGTSLDDLSKKGASALITHLQGDMIAAPDHVDGEALADDEAAEMAAIRSEGSDEAPPPPAGNPDDDDDMPF